MTKLGQMIRLWRDKNRYGTREAAKMIGITSSTLNRIEHGEEMNAKTLIKIIVWLMEPSQ